MTTKILVLASNPQGTEQLRLNPEIREIEEALERGKNREKFVLRSKVAVRVEDLQRSIRKEAARIVHFCGHGTGSQGLVLETTSGQQQFLDTQAIADLFKLFKNQVECVVLNACYSQVQATEINQHINYVIGTKREIRDDAAVAFSTGFYEALGDGESIERAYEFGCNRIQLEIYGSSNSERKLVPVYSEVESKWVELPQQEVIELKIKEPLDTIVDSSATLTADSTKILQRPFITRSPYKGLKRFNAVDKDLFFGRERLTNKIIEAVNQSNLVLVLGASGSGKSSVVRAGVIPQIESFLETPFQCCLFTPNRNPFISFHRSLLDPTKDIFSEEEVEFVLESKNDTFTKTTHLLKSKYPQWVIFIDQFEELFTICSNLETRRNFIEGIISIARNTDRSVKLILAMRSDFLEELSTYPQFARIAQNNINLVADMQTEELRQAIEQPAAQHGVMFESGLVEEIVQDVQGQAGSLPLLQYTLDLLWQDDELANRTLNIVTYRQLGGVRGALQKHINQIYQQLSSEQQLATKQILLRLVDVVGLEQSEVLRTAVSRRAYKSEFTETQVDTVNLLVNKSLLVSDDLNQEGQSTVEIAHEALLASWVELKNWITDARNTIALNNRLAEDATRWQELKKINPEQAKDELWSGSKLEQVIELRKDGTFNVVLGGLSDIVKDFIDASEAWRDKKQRETVRLQRRAIKWLSGGLTIALVASGVAFWQRGIALRQSKMAFARQLAATSEWIRSQKANLHEASVLLALESLKTAQEIDEPSPEANSALRDGLNLLPNHIALIAHQDRVWEIAFSADGEYFATGSEDGTAKIVQLSTGQEIATIAHQDAVWEIAFSPDGEYLATRSSNNVRLDLLDTKKLIQKTCQSLSQNLSMGLWQRYVDNQPYRKTCPNLPIHPSFLKEGRKLAQEGKIAEAVSIYKRAKKLQPDIDLNPNTKNIDKDPKVVVNKFFAPTKLKQGVNLAKEGKISEAISTYKQAQNIDPSLEIDAESWNELCKFGSIYRHAQKVLFACKKAVELAPDKASYLDSRGLARALTGNTQEAIIDFQAFVDSNELSEEFEELIDKRKQWIKALKNGEDPFTDEVLEELKNEVMSNE